jgi:hypothetical protein
LEKNSSLAVKFADKGENSQKNAKNRTVQNGENYIKFLAESYN